MRVCRYFDVVIMCAMLNSRKLLIKGMVCDRCVIIVKSELEKAGFETNNILLGEVTLTAPLTAEQEIMLQEKLSPFGFKLIEDKREKIIQQVKVLLKEVYSGSFDFPATFRFSELAVQRLGIEYEKISTAFSETENITLEKYVIDYRTDKVKELLVYTDDTLADIAFKLNYSSVAHLSRQFKQQTGLTPSHFKQIRKDKSDRIKSKI